MKVIIPMGGLGTRMRPHTWSRPKSLLNVAGNTVIGHILDELAEVTTDEVIFVVGYKGDEIEAWIREHYPHLNAHFVIQEEALGQAHAIWLCREFLDEQDVMICFGDGVIKAAYEELGQQPEADAVFLVEEVEDPSSFGVVALNEAGNIVEFIEKPDDDKYRLAIAGVYWFRDGNYLMRALKRVMEEGLQTKGEYYLADAFQVMLGEGGKLRTQVVSAWLDGGKPENILYTNKRLLGMGGYETKDAVERSYVEDFTVLPPVYIDETAVIENAVIGPYVSVGAGAVIRRAVVRNSIIDDDAVISDCVLDGALVGERAEVIGRGSALFVGDDAQITL
ncbi:MAG TPA: sugar phosphate nucleotidyltransferase [Anaerolineae bacterium]|nr:sugar phosphate nucleotidyltransferase [Anaerolineae bacterium]